MMLFGFALLFAISLRTVVWGSDSSDRRKYKVILLGPPAAGKSCFLGRLLRDDSLTTGTAGSVPPTIGASYHQLLVNEDMALQFWDTAGQERFRALVQMYTRGAHVAIFVYDVCAEGSLVEMREVFEGMSGELRASDCLLLVVGMKRDLLAGDQSYRLEVAQTMLRNEGVAGFFATSAVASGDNDDFEETRQQILSLIVTHCNHVILNDSDSAFQLQSNPKYAGFNQNGGNNQNYGNEDDTCNC